jgi:hypothetical protein
MFTFVTIIYNNIAENKLLQLQAKTFYLVDSCLITAIYVIYNDNNFEEYKKMFNNEIIEHYPENIKKKVKLLSGDSFFILNTSRHKNNNNTGWKNQQILKLYVSQIIDTEYYIVLDSKDHFINYVDYNTFFLNGNPIYLYFKKENIPRMKCYLSHSMKYFKNYTKTINDKTGIINLNDKNRVYNLIWPITPFLFNTKTVQMLIDFITNKENQKFEDVFLEKAFCEFYLYYSYTIFIKLADTFIYKDHVNSKVWYNLKVVDVVNKDLINSIYNKQEFCFGISKYAYEKFDLNDKLLLLSFYKKVYTDDVILFIINIFDIFA